MRGLVAGFISVLALAASCAPTGAGKKENAPLDPRAAMDLRAKAREASAASRFAQCADLYAQAGRVAPLSRRADGMTPQDFQKAHSLALKAVEIDPANGSARWLAAAAKDRELMNLGKPQLYGTQFRKVDGRWELYQVDPAVTDAQRAEWGAPPIAEAMRRADAMNQKGK